MKNNLEKIVQFAIDNGFEYNDGFNNEKVVKFSFVGDKHIYFVLEKSGTTKVFDILRITTSKSFLLAVLKGIARKKGDGTITISGSITYHYSDEVVEYGIDNCIYDAENCFREAFDDLTDEQAKAIREETLDDFLEELILENQI